MSALDVGKMLPELQRAGLLHFKILRSRIPGNGDIVLHGHPVVPLHYRAANAAALAGGHFNKALVDLSFPDILQGSHAVLHSVQSQIGVFRISLCHGPQHTAGGGEKSGPGFLLRLHDRSRLHLLPLHPEGQLFKGKYRIHNAFVVLSLILFCHTGTNKDGSGIGDSSFNIRAVGLHGRDHIRQAVEQIRIVLLDQQIDGMAAGGDDHIPVILPDHPLIFGLDHRSAHGSLLHLVKAQLFQSFPHGFNTGTVVVCHKGGRQAHHHRIAGLEKGSDLFRAVHDLLCILGTYRKAPAAENALVSNNMGLIGRKANGLHRAVTNALITVFAVGFLKCQTIGHILLSFLHCFQNILHKEHLKILRGNTCVDLIIHLNGHTVTIAFSDAEASGKHHIILKAMLFQLSFEQIHNLSGSFQVAGASHAY